ncbi:TetR/AcrR family transcriptional regulator [Alkalicoccobacillus porphyridii]|uniref:TetR/AcrR family transcriptional regulator n=1 Tax=Alkalicoccobacillus porphyridii TaxID=2597270 RepID=A0A554A190_9BACI|nr:TetR/AcrR family transcriptional regulator [Alkalicoccobacillus porphyridii]TSB47445.1 TetR/AcrR family transcriptional regulator [Alkalicoccobacillus porphyridii]
MDRRIKKSQRAIEASLIKLMNQKSFEDITIHEIAEEADVSRGTIYLNYEDKYHILHKCMDAELNKLIESCTPNQSSLHEAGQQALLLQTLEYIKSNSDIFIMLLETKGVETFREKLLTLLKENMFIEVKLEGINQGMDREIFAQFWTVAVIGVIEWWIKNSLEYSSEDIAEHLFTILSRNEVVG